MPPCSLSYIRKDLNNFTIGEAYSKFRELNIVDINLFDIFETDPAPNKVINSQSISFKPNLRNKPKPRLTYKINNPGPNRMTNQQNQSKVKDKPNSKERGDKCKVCLEDVKELDKGINCDVCACWHHTKCIQMNDASYKFFMKEKLQWVCSDCIKSKREENELRELVLEMIEKSDEEKENEKEERALMMMMIKKMSEQMTGMEKMIEDKINEKIKISEKCSMEKIIKMERDVDEKFEAFRRRKNIIVYGMPEKDERDEKKRGEIDQINISNLLIELGTNVRNYEISRLGKQITEGRPRPMRIELIKESDKYAVLKGAFKLKNTRNETFKRISITTDMSYKQREAEQILREELKERKRAGEKNIKIRKGRIVKEEEGGRSQR